MAKKKEKKAGKRMKKSEMSERLISLFPHKTERNIQSETIIKQSEPYYTSS